MEEDRDGVIELPRETSEAGAIVNTSPRFEVLEPVAQTSPSMSRHSVAPPEIPPLSANDRDIDMVDASDAVLEVTATASIPVPTGHERQLPSITATSPVARPATAQRFSTHLSDFLHKTTEQQNSKKRRLSITSSDLQNDQQPLLKKRMLERQPSHQHQECPIPASNEGHLPNHAARVTPQEQNLLQPPDDHVDMWNDIPAQAKKKSLVARFYGAIRS